MIIATSQCHEIAITMKLHRHEYRTSGTGKCHTKIDKQSFNALLADY